MGGDEMNQKLSENRAGAVRDYLVQQGVVATSVSATGFGNSSPVATNDNSAGRQENRRVYRAKPLEARSTQQLEACSNASEYPLRTRERPQRMLTERPERQWPSSRKSMLKNISQSDEP